jgi:hypothetical protein
MASLLHFENWFHWLIGRRRNQMKHRETNPSPEEPQEKQSRTEEITQTTPTHSHQRSPMNDPSMRDGDSGRGNLNETAQDEMTSDNDVGDMPGDFVDNRQDQEERRGLAGANEERNQEFLALEEQFREEGRYPGREEEVAARIVNKQRSEFAETKEAQEKEKQGQSPDQELPIKRYNHLTVAEVLNRIKNLSDEEIRAIQQYEQSHRKRKTLLNRLDRRLQESSKG